MNWTERFWQKVDKSGDCWEWKAARFPSGYGAFALNGKNLRAHRVSYRLHFGEPGEMMVCHRCDNPACVNPAHLFLGTGSDNMRDAWSKGRLKKLKPPPTPNAKLTENMVRRIRTIGDAIPQYVMAEMFGVSKQAISAVLRRETWQGIEGKAATV